MEFLRSRLQLLKVFVDSSDCIGQAQPFLSIVPTQDEMSSVVGQLTIVLLMSRTARFDMAVLGHGCRIQRLKLLKRFASYEIKAQMNLGTNPWR